MAWSILYSIKFENEFAEPAHKQIELPCFFYFGPIIEKKFVAHRNMRVYTV